MEKIDDGKNKKHTGKLTDNPEDVELLILHVSGMRLCSIRGISGCQIEGYSL